MMDSIGFNEVATVSSDANIESTTALGSALDDDAVDKLESNLKAHSPITLKEQMDIEFTTRRKQEASAKMKRKLAAVEDFEKLKDKIITFKYATDYSFLRGSTPDDVWIAIQRREAWRTIPLSMVAVTLVQNAVCVTTMISNNAAVDISTLVISAVFVLALSASNSFTISHDLTVIIRKFHAANTKDGNNAFVFYGVVIILSPIIFAILSIAYTVTLILDFTTGPILDVSFTSAIKIIVNILLVFSALSLGLRSDNLLTAIQVFAGFHFVSQLDYNIVSKVKIDLMAPVKRTNEVSAQILSVRMVVYVSSAILFALSVYLTISNRCVIFCSDSNVIIP